MVKQLNEPRASIDTHTSLYLYKEIKSIFQLSLYITLLQNITYRNILAKLRKSSHNLQIECGRFYKISRHDINEIYVLMEVIMKTNFTLF